jgi:hypothetical protein
MRRQKRNWAIISSNCSIGGAIAAPIAFFSNREEAQKALEEHPTGCWVEEISAWASHISEVSEEWVEHPSWGVNWEEGDFIMKVSLFHAEKPAHPLKQSFTLWARGFPSEINPDRSLEFEFLAELIFKGFNTPKGLLGEVAEMAILGELPEELNPGLLAVWVQWFQNVKFGNLI